MEQTLHETLSLCQLTEFLQQPREVWSDAHHPISQQEKLRFGEFEYACPELTASH